MRKDSSLTEQQRIAVRALFVEGHGRDAVATHLGVSPSAVRRLHDRWRIRGDDALVAKATKRVYSFELKLGIVRRFLAGETQGALAEEFGMPSPDLVATWARAYRRDGDAGLRPKPKGRPRKEPTAPQPELTELERLQQENEYLRAKVAYLEKLKALMAQEQQ